MNHRCKQPAESIGHDQRPAPLAVAGRTDLGAMTGTSAVDTTIIRQAFIAAPLPKWPETGWTALYSAPPTARTLAPTGFRIHVWCKACRHSVNADLDALIRNGIPLVR